MYLGLPALGTFMSQGLPALGTFMSPGLPALVARARRFRCAWRWQTDGPEVMKVCRVLQSPERDVIVVGDLVVARMSHHGGHLMDPHHSVTDLTNQITP